MKRQLVLVLVLTLGVAMVWRIAGSSLWPHMAGAEAPRTDAAFRDGLYQARLDIQNGRKPRIASGRWSSEHDRASFIAGYEQTYRALAGAGATTFMAPTASELAGYRDGTLDGAQDRRMAQPFRGSKTENYKKADQYYRQAYTNGYQTGYYSGIKNPELKTISEESRPF